MDFANTKICKTALKHLWRTFSLRSLPGSPASCTYMQPNQQHLLCWLSTDADCAPRFTARDNALDSTCGYPTVISCLRPDTLLRSLDMPHAGKVHRKQWKRTTTQ